MVKGWTGSKTWMAGAVAAAAAIAGDTQSPADHALHLYPSKLTVLKRPVCIRIARDKWTAHAGHTLAYLLDCRDMNAILVRDLETDETFEADTSTATRDRGWTCAPTVDQTRQAVDDLKGLGYEVEVKRRIG